MINNEVTRHIKTHTERSSEDQAAVHFLENHLKSDGRINLDFAAVDKWPNTDGRFEFVSNPDISRRPEQDFVVQIKGTHYYEERDGKMVYQLKSLAFPAFIYQNVSLDPGILFLVTDPDERGEERVFWKYMSAEYVHSIDYSKDSCTVKFDLEDEIKYTDKSIDQFCKKLEEIADAEYAKTGKYIRPIALFQAQPKGKEDATTFEKLRDKLVDAGIPAEQIAIRTADVNELKNTDLMSPNCPIRYIITVNALKEGWDCPFAYILASLANKTSQVDVEQILGRILRLPHTSQHTQSALNMSYVLTSSNDFNNTVAHIVKGLNSAGFSDKDYRIGESAKPQIPEQPAEQITLPDQQGCSKTETPLETAEDDFSGLDGKSIGAELERRREQAQTPEIAPKANTMLDAAAEVEKAYTDAIQQTGNDPVMDNLPWEVRDKVKSFQVNPQFREDIETLQIPQFFLKIEQSLFTDGSFELLDKEMLAEGFTLKGKAYDIDFATADDEIREIDVREQDGGLPKVFKMESAEQRYFKEWFNNLPPESRVRQCKDMMFNQLNKVNMVDAAELKAYINRIVDDMDKAQLAAMEKAPLGYAAKIRSKIETLLEAHYRENFERWLETERIVCKPYFRLRPSIHPATYTDIYARSLYAAEDGDMNKLEQKLIVELTALPNVRWWHRNIARQDFAINGFIKHYPDILIMTQSGKLICAETKGEHLKNDDSREKIALGQAWRTAAGKDFRYYMVFENEENLLPGAVSMSQFIDTVKAL